MIESLDDGQSIYESLGTKTLQDDSNVELFISILHFKITYLLSVLFAFLLRLNDSQERISLHVGSYSRPT